MHESRIIKFRAWDGVKMRGVSKNDYFSIRNDGLPSQNVDVVLMQFSGLQDSLGNDIYEGDKVYLAGYGVYVAEFPFTELYDAKRENDLGEIVGCLYS